MQDIETMLLNSPCAKGWKHIGISPHHGITLALSSLHSKNSCGIGEFFDLLPLIDWCNSIKMDIIQLLPLNDSGSDMSPYSALSSCALSPLYLSLHALPHLGDDHPLIKKFSELQQLNLTQRVAYSEVQSGKLNWLEQYYEETHSLIINTPAFNDFIKDNGWVEAYALFKVLKKKLEQNSWLSWPDELKSPSPKQYHELLEHHNSEINFHITLQFLCFLQLSHVKNYASTKGVFLKGDIPILINLDSADVWRHTEYFDLNLSAGSPPDIYSRQGQNWGFPIFKLEKTKEHHFGWWRQRLQYAKNFYDIYRIDHIVGFFRIWAIPQNHTIEEGFFIPQNAEIWISHGTEYLLIMIEASAMLPVGEDLGCVPNEIKACLQNLSICGTKVMRWERLWEEEGKFIPIQNYHPISMTCVSTHDSETLQLWWQNNSDEAMAFAAYKNWEYAPTLTTQQRQEILWDSHHTSSLLHINLLQEYLALFPELVWPQLEDERINVPGTIAPTNWSYRFRPSVEEIFSHEQLKEKMQQIL